MDMSNKLTAALTSQCLLHPFMQYLLIFFGLLVKWICQIN